MQTSGRHERPCAKVVYRSVNVSVCTSFSHYYLYLVLYDYTPCLLPTVVEDVVVLL